MNANDQISNDLNRSTAQLIKYTQKCTCIGAHTSKNNRSVISNFELLKTQNNGSYINITFIIDMLRLMLDAYCLLCRDVCLFIFSSITYFNRFVRLSVLPTNPAKCANGNFLKKLKRVSNPNSLNAALNEWIVHVHPFWFCVLQLPVMFGGTIIITALRPFQQRLWPITFVYCSHRMIKIRWPLHKSTHETWRYLTLFVLFVVVRSMCSSYDICTIFRVFYFIWMHDISLFELLD